VFPVTTKCAPALFNTGPGRLDFGERHSFHAYRQGSCGNQRKQGGNGAQYLVERPSAESTTHQPQVDAPQGGPGKVDCLAGASPPPPPAALTPWRWRETP